MEVELAAIEQIRTNAVSIRCSLYSVEASEIEFATRCPHQLPGREVKPITLAIARDPSR